MRRRRYALRSSSSGLVSPLIVVSSSPADRRPIDPPPIVQLRVINHDRRNRGSPSPSPPPPPPQHPQGHTHESPLDASMLTPAGFGQTFLQNPYYFMFASLAKPDDDTELHWMKVRALVLMMIGCVRGRIYQWANGLGGLCAGRRTSSCVALRCVIG